MRQKQAPVRHCSFCHKNESEHGVKLISSPADYPQAFICEACVAVCASILEDDVHAEHDPQPQAPVACPAAPPESPLSHPAASELITSAEQWITREASGDDASKELDHLRTLAKLMFVNPNA
ncbi:MAG TPA: ClpX C4-type zinc finger protein [Bryobacteraceae bacterium]|nr:ClpX C4-type zinc finger protein [Bryobacteraceae bacterium]